MSKDTESKRGRPTKQGGSMQGFPVRLDQDIITRLDAVAERESQRGYNITRSDIVRRAIIELLEREEVKKYG
jgi:predicted transcriptional regulator